MMGRPFGIPKTGDLRPARSRRPRSDAPCRCLAGSRSLPKDDPYQALRRDLAALRQDDRRGLHRPQRQGRLLSHGARGRGASGWRRSTSRPGNTGRSRRRGSTASPPPRRGLRALVEQPGQGRALCLARALRPAELCRRSWRRRSPTISPASMAPCAIGYNWKFGPFELIDRMGARYLAERLAEEKLPVPPLIAKAARPAASIASARATWRSSGSTAAIVPSRGLAGVLLLADIKRAGKALAANGSASLWDIGDGVACLEFHSKMNSLDPDSFQLLRQSLDLVAKRKLKALVIYNEGDNFSVGLNLGLALFSANLAMWPMIEDMVATGQQTYKTIKYSAVPRRGRAVRHGAGRGLRNPSALRQHRRPCRELYRPGGGGRGACPRLGRLQGAAGAQHGPSPGPWPDAAGGRDLRDHLHRQGRPLRRRGEGSWASSAPATRSS